jgi:hypothetical protein
VDKYLLLEYIQALDLSADAFISAFTMGIRLHAVEVYNQNAEYLHDNPNVADEVSNLYADQCYLIRSIFSKIKLI